jgi:hypothetical protein
VELVDLYLLETQVKVTNVPRARRTTFHSRRFVMSRRSGRDRTGWGDTETGVTVQLILVRYYGWLRVRVVDVDGGNAEITSMKDIDSTVEFHLSGRPGLETQ